MKKDNSWYLKSMTSVKEYIEGDYDLEYTRMDGMDVVFDISRIKDTYYTHGIEVTLCNIYSHLKDKNPNGYIGTIFCTYRKVGQTTPNKYVSFDIYEEKGDFVYYISSRMSTSSNISLLERAKEYIGCKRKCPLNIEDLMSYLRIDKESIFDRPNTITLKQSSPSKINERIFYNHGGYSYNATVKKILDCKVQATEEKVDLIVKYEVNHSRYKSLSN